MKFFNPDGPYQKYGSIIFDILTTNIIWVILTFFSFGLLYGPATCGLYASQYSNTVTKEGYCLKNFLNYFKKRFLLTFLIGILNILFLIIDIFNIYLVLFASFGSIYLLPVYIFIFLELMFIASYIYPLLIHSNLKVKNILKYAFLLSNCHLPISLVAALLNTSIVVIILLPMFGFFEIFPLILFIPSIIAAINSNLISKKVLSKFDFFVSF